MRERVRGHCCHRPCPLLPWPSCSCGPCPRLPLPRGMVARSQQRHVSPIVRSIQIQEDYSHLQSADHDLPTHTHTLAHVSKPTPAPNAFCNSSRPPCLRIRNLTHERNHVRHDTNNTALSLFLKLDLIDEYVRQEGDLERTSDIHNI